MQSTLEQFKDKGFSIVENIISEEQIKILHQNVQKGLQHCANELDCSLNNYLSSVSRWLHPSPVTVPTMSWVNSDLNQIVSDLMSEKVTLSKMNVISKSEFSNLSIPCHQDIAYSKNDPYEFSLWLPLQKVARMDGTLEFLPGSHLEKIQPAVDFWQPNYTDDVYSSSKWQQKAVSVPLESGQAIIFDSRVWHRSSQNESGALRLALVTRWKRKSYKPPTTIPEKHIAGFGMWNCGKLTTSLLNQGLRACFDIALNETDLLNALCLWQSQLNERVNLPFTIDVPTVQISLKRLEILHRAYHLHQGGDAIGNIYRQVWNHFLAPLSQWLSTFQDSSINIGDLYHDKII